MKAHYADVGIVNMIRQRLKDIKLQRQLSEINNNTRKDANQSNKMKTYWLFKTIDFRIVKITYIFYFVHQVANTQHRITLTELRPSNHKLAIETGHYSRLFKKPEERSCPICKIEMEDKYHFLNTCSAQQIKRCLLLDYLEVEHGIKKAECHPTKYLCF